MSELRDLRNVNLNLLPVLRELLRHGSVTEAAKALGLSQSSVSGSLKVLREHFDDELITTVGRQTTLTAYARELIGPVDESLEAMVGVLFRRAFDPEAASGRFYVAMVDYIASVVAPPLAESLQDRFAGLSMQMVQVSPGSFDELQRGDVDLLLSVTEVTDFAIKERGLPPEALGRQRLWVDELVGIARAGNAVPTSVEAFAAQPHASFQIAPGRASIEQRILDRLKVVRNDRIVIPNLQLLPLIVARSDCLSIVPESLARCVAKVFDLTVFALPFDVPPIYVEMVWMARDSGSPRLRWLRDTLCDVVARTDYLPD